MTKKEIRQRDKEFTEKIKEQADYKCEKCSSSKGRLNVHHVFDRSNRNVRWDVDNGILLDAYHHYFSIFSPHKNPNFIFWLIEKRGRKWWNRLKKKALKGEKLEQLAKN